MPTKAEVLAILARRGVNIEGLGQSTTSAKPTEDQGKAATYGKLMAPAERSYQRAVSEGYNPGSFKNTAASIAEGLPFGGLDGIGALIRDDVSDRARQAEMQWSDAQLKAMSGAASPEEEVKRNIKTYFPRPGETFSDIAPQKAESRLAGFESARIRSGPLAQKIGLYPGEPGSSADKPIDMGGEDVRSTLPLGAFYRDAEGNVRENKNGTRGNPIVRKAQANAMLKAKSAKAQPAQEDIVIDIFGKPVK